MKILDLIRHSTKKRFTKISENLVKVEFLLELKGGSEIVAGIKEYRREQIEGLLEDKNSEIEETEKFNKQAKLTQLKAEKADIEKMKNELK
jgi:hypothetical protein